MSSHGSARKIAWIAGLCLSGCATAGDAGENAAPTMGGRQDNSEGAEPDERACYPIRGTLSSRYRGRWESDAKDHDLYQVLTLETGDAESDRVTAHFMGQAAYDLDGADSEGNYAFFSLEDTYDSAITARLYHAYADVHTSGLDTLRLGRQLIYETPEVAYFDGVRVETEELGDKDVQFGVYGGIPVHPFESSPAGDLILGVSGEARPWRGSRVRLDWMHLEDESLLGENQDDLATLSLDQSFESGFRVGGEYSLLEGEERDFRLRASAYAEEQDLACEVSFYKLLRTQSERSIPFDPFFATLFELFPYWQSRVLFSKGFEAGITLEAGFDLRLVDDSNDVGEFNRDFERYHLTTTLDELPADLELSLTGELWESEDSDIRSWGLDLRRQLTDELSATVGTYFSLFKYELYTDEEHEDVRTWYTALAWRRAKGPRFDVRYEFEDADIDQFHYLRLGATWSF